MSLPNPPALPGSGFPSAYYVNILDGVAGRMFFSNSSGGAGYVCQTSIGGSPQQVPMLQLLTQDQALDGCPVGSELTAAGTGATWHLNGVIAVSTPVLNGSQCIAIDYNGSALPAMPNGVIPAGVTFIEQPWAIEDNGLFQDFMQPNASTDPELFHQIFFVPNFTMEGGTAPTAALTSETAQNIVYTLAKPLNSNQTGKVTVTAQLTDLGAGSSPVTVPATLLTNSNNQIYAVSVALTAAQVGNGFSTSANGTVTLNATQTLTYLVGNQLVPSATVALLTNKAIALSVSTVSGTSLAISSFGITNAGHLNMVAGGTFWAQGTDPVIGAFTAIAGVCWTAFTVTQNPAQSPITSVKLTLQPTTGGQYAYTGAAVTLKTWTPLSSQLYNFAVSDSWTLPSNFAVPTIMQCRLMLTAYDKAGNVVSSYAISGSAVTTEWYYINNPNIYNVATTGFVHTSSGTVTAQADGWFFSPNGGFNLYADGGGAKTYPNGTLVSSCQTFGTTTDIRYPTSFTGAISMTVPAGVGAIPVDSTSDLWLSAVTIQHGEVFYPNTVLTVTLYTNSCVPVGTMVETSAGPVPIENLKAGMVIRGYDEHTLEALETEVETVYVFDDQPTLRLTTTHGSLVCSTSHRVGILDAGAQLDWPAAKDIKVGQHILWLLKGEEMVEAEVTEVEPLDPTTVYHLTVKAGHVFVAGSVPAHNKGGGGGCVPAGTMLETAAGPMAIELVKVGDLVRGYDEHTLAPVITPVTHTFTYEDRALYRFTTQAGTIVASHDHRPWRKRAWEGPEPLGHYPPLRAFVPGDITLWEVDGALVETEVLAVEPLGRAERVYHLTMAEGHMYVAGSLPAHNLIKIQTPN